MLLNNHCATYFAILDASLISTPNFYKVRVFTRRSTMASLLQYSLQKTKTVKNPILIAHKDIRLTKINEF